MTDPWLVQFEARRKAREEQDRSFEILGERLVARPNVAPEIAVRFGSLAKRFADYAAAVRAAEAAGEPLPDESGITDEEMLDVSEATVRACLTADSLPAWERLRAPDHPDPLGLFDVYGLASFVLSKVVALPTDAPTGSSNGRSTTDPSSTDASPSPAKTRKASRSAAT